MNSENQAELCPVLNWLGLAAYLSALGNALKCTWPHDAISHVFDLDFEYVQRFKK